ncbi:adenosylmethionine--8-amino-7-oxononanoate transaminase [Corynebacterium sp. zg254]|uniref:Adenosylmethionine-8-amino-7-oxononanoate aminotransferase n=1 Tax=Corynebacterium zhongnanshanii TaxID=2768834 RepID=A0ABQ6VFS5_9CORY|nr:MULTISPECIES: adenosylmethionine--8-amino-7-oxononanoate transaminase [Corynebacterium]KAB3523255.1 adenosylmethionine--8-amino-7-oxononanoate transaminase [Corynebacterium zhongnanshanii]MCR5913627.1 adenosylmethionine--8-amino-7-oxononanoate transaminase [Corynebacterium sp. zg254]
MFNSGSFHAASSHAESNTSGRTARATQAAIRHGDRQFLWHPYAPRTSPTDNLVVDSTDGVHLTLGSGQRVIDGMSSWWAAAHGHGYPHITAAAHRQIDTMSHVMFGGLTHAPAVELGERLIALCPSMDSVFFSDSGSVAIEVALKMALQAQRGLGRPDKTRFLTWRGGYHGDTQGPMSVCDPDNGMHSLWGSVLRPQVFVDAPPPRGSSSADLRAYMETVRAELVRPDSDIAGVIVEPIVQGAGGMTFHDAELLRHLRELCTETSTVLIFDEIATGFGRTGRILACDHAGVAPDILCLGKALTGGFMSFAATLAAEWIARAIDTPAGGGALMHGPTFMGNPLACAVACAALDLIDSGYWKESVPRIEQELRDGLEDLADHPAVADVRCLGAIGVVEMREPLDMALATRTVVEHGVWLRPFGRLLYTMPPFISTSEHIATITRAMRAVVAAHTPGEGLS